MKSSERHTEEAHLVVDVVAAHSDGVHDVLPSLVLSRGAVRDVVRVVFRSKVMTELVSRHQVGFLWRRHKPITDSRTPPQ